MTAAAPDPLAEDVAPQTRSVALRKEHVILALKVVGQVIKWALVLAFAATFAAAGGLVLGWAWAAWSSTTCAVADGCRIDPLFDIEYAVRPATLAFWVGFPVATLGIGMSAWRAGRSR